MVHALKDDSQGNIKILVRLTFRAHVTTLLVSAAPQQASLLPWFLLSEKQGLKPDQLESQKAKERGFFLLAETLGEFQRLDVHEGWKQWTGKQKPPPFPLGSSFFKHEIIIDVLELTLRAGNEKVYMKAG